MYIVDDVVVADVFGVRIRVISGRRTFVGPMPDRPALPVRYDVVEKTDPMTLRHGLASTPPESGAAHKGCGG